eukprot:9118631-Pyramimonas_sp.AAC.1
MQAVPVPAQVRLIKGPTGAIIHTLLRLGWTPHDPTTWSFQVGPDRSEEWQFPDHIYTGKPH